MHETICQEANENQFFQTHKNYSFTNRITIINVANIKPEHLIASRYHMNHLIDELQNPIKSFFEKYRPRTKEIRRRHKIEINIQIVR